MDNKILVTLKYPKTYESFKLRAQYGRRSLTENVKVGVNVVDNATEVAQKLANKLNLGSNGFVILVEDKNPLFYFKVN